VEIGGTDQKFNILRGREMQRSSGQESQVGLFMPILIGTDGKEKMSKSLGNVISINESAQSIYHKLYNIPDSLIEDYLTLLTEKPLQEISSSMKKIDSGEMDPKQVKRELAKSIVAQYHGEEKAGEAMQKELSIHLGEAVPENMPELQVEPGEHWLPALMVSAGLVKSNGEARRMILNGGVQFEGEKVLDPKANVSVTSQHILKVGKRNFVRIAASS
jgi:tyrosyl-tRNA synthetase